jgi:hypothetical protein
MPIRHFFRSTTMLSSIVGASFIAVMAAQAADAPITKAPYAPPPALPAVDGVNYKVEAFGGVLDEDGNFGVAGAYSIPLGFRYGLQLDGMASSADGDFLGDVAGHLFWRDPAVGLLGLYASYTHWGRFGGIYQTHVGLEFERYHGPWSIEGLIGAESGNSKSRTSSGVITTYDIDSRFFDYLDLSYYPQENLKLSIGHRYLLGDHALALGAEWGRPLGNGRMGSFFLEGQVGEGNFKSVWAGFRMYFGQGDKSLIQRHREDDPKIKRRRKPDRTLTAEEEDEIIIE